MRLRSNGSLGESSSVESAPAEKDVSGIAPERIRSLSTTIPSQRPFLMSASNSSSNCCAAGSSTQFEPSHSAHTASGENNETNSSTLKVSPEYSLPAQLGNEKLFFKPKSLEAHNKPPSVASSVQSASEILATLGADSEPPPPLQEVRTSDENTTNFASHFMASI